MRHVTKVIFHHSGSDHSAHDNIATIRDWHLRRGWIGEGYHFYIRKNGCVEIGRPLTLIGAHCKGQNKDSIGICLGGHSSFTEMQFHTAARLVQNLKQFYPGLVITAHKDYSKTECPNYDINKIKERLHELETLSATSMGWWSKSCS
jgi:hypothetical protein